MDRSFRNALLFLAGTLLITWAFYMPILVFGLDPHSSGFLLLLLGGSAPSWLGVIMALATYDKEGRRDYFRRIYQIKRIKPVWWAALLLLFPAIVAASIGLAVLFGGTVPGMANLKAILANPLSWFPLVGISFVMGPFAEELGWRGYALDPLLKRFGFARSGLLLGLVWGVWHWPLFFMPQMWNGQIGLTGFVLFLLMNVGLSWIMSWVYVNNRRSTLTALLLHLSSNFAGQLVASETVTGMELYDVIRCALIAAVGAGIAVYMILARKDAVGAEAGFQSL